MTLATATVPTPTVAPAILATATVPTPTVAPAILATATARTPTVAPAILTTATVETPVGPFTIVARERADGSAAVLASGWSPDAASLLALVGAGRLAADPRAVGDMPGAGRRSSPLDAASLTRRDHLGPITQAVRDYLDGDVHAIDAVEVEQAGAPFTTRAWSQLRAIPAGSPQTYAQLAANCGSPSAVRAAGSACARNTAALFVPCHRVLRTGGALGGFLYGLDVKRWLLAHEAAAGAAMP
jgi:methylated-DNA-[protein]-cysteine S-methyltransferase